MSEVEANAAGGRQTNCMKRKKTIMQVVRVVIILAVFAAFGYHMNLQCRKYLENPQTTPVVKVMQSSQFPDVTICYPTYFNKARLQNKYQNELNYLDVFEKNLKFLWEMVKLNSSNVSGLDYVQGVEYIPQAELTLLPHMAQHPVGARVYDSLMFCSYSGIYCDFQNFTTFRDGTYGLCFQFTPSESISILPGIKNGLAVIIENLETSRVKFDDIFGGLNIFVHPRNTWPTSEKLAAMGQSVLQTAISFNYESVLRPSKADSPCKEPERRSLCRMEVPTGLVCRPYIETDPMLRQVSLQIALEDRCNCVTYEWPIPEKLRSRVSCHFIPEAAYLHRGINLSSTFEVSIRPINASLAFVPLAAVADMQKVRRRYECYANFRKGFADGSIKGKSKICTKDQSVGVNVCASESHQTLIQSLWFDKMIPNLRKHNLTSVALKTVEKKNFHVEYKSFLSTYGVQVNVFQNFIAGVKKEESFLYNYLYFIADIGGVTGLWIGMSFITIFEVSEWIVRKLVKARKVKLSSSSVRAKE